MCEACSLNYDDKYAHYFPKENYVANALAFFISK
jgi:hypothetical protein